MPTRNPRLQIVRDPALDRAIARGRAALGPGLPASQVVHRLALRGADALEGDAAVAASGADFLVSVADGTAGLDLDSLRTVRERAWR